MTYTPETQQALDVYANAALQYLRCLDELNRARNARDAALVGVHQSGVRKCHMWTTVRDYLFDHGFDMKSHVGRLALSPGSIKVVLERARQVNGTSSDPGGRSSWR